MKRRNFVRNAAIGALSLGVSTPDMIAAPLVSQSTAVSQWLRQLCWSLSGRRRSEARFAPEAFTELTTGTNERFAKQGYKAANDAFYFFGEQESWCFYPLMMRLAASDVTPFVVPVFHRQGNTWRQVKVLDGFEIEAILRASQTLVEHDAAALQNLLVPIEKSAVYPGSMAYKTSEGVVAIKTRFQRGTAHTTCTIVGREGKVLNETFVSRHRLIATSRLS